MLASTQSIHGQPACQARRSGGRGVPAAAVRWRQTNHPAAVRGRWEQWTKDSGQWTAVGDGGRNTLRSYVWRRAGGS
ncbi:hypothetical protein BO71DRAFT_395623 [Aspergillus ellipticus CBS 707.79]|uniref:Uncharacterized protein n=1 Tax=Aspergillus ellipticus CBS 707.79 TaxID=1448320 RepID=A0A319DUZ2_9EURO|nr:hypothetical protein BO71DRAFT_395623 [Aspergillus ellipticus CBS 707.79]